MVAVAQQDFGPFVDEGGIAFGLVVVAPIGKFAPDQVAELVGPIEEPRLEDLLVQPRAVVTGGHRHLDVVLQRLVGGGGPDAVGIKTLVENQPLEDRLAVDQDPPARRSSPSADRSSFSVRRSSRCRGSA